MFLLALFVILGWVCFAPPPPGSQARIVLLVVYVMLLVLWALQGSGTITVPYGGGKW